MKVLFINGSRGEWGYIRPLIRHCQTRGIEYAICATNMLLLPGYGTLVDEIRREGFNVSDEIFMSLEGHNHFTMVKSLGVFLTSFVDVVHRVKPQWIVLAGDRGEQLMAAIAGAYTYTPVAHIQAGEKSGNIDGVTRHGIGKFVHLHFAANQDAAGRLLQLGEEEFRVHLVGAPQLDELVDGDIPDADQMSARYAIPVDREYLLVVQHPVTEEMYQARTQVEELVHALDRFSMPKVWILTNNDAGATVIRQTILNLRTSDVFLFDNVTRRDYLGFMQHCTAMVGNSSSGLLEAPTFKTPAVNLGRRQADRIRGQNVIDAPFERDEIASAISRAISSEFRDGLASCENPYGDGRSAARILDVLQKMPVDDRLLIKRLTV